MQLKLQISLLALTIFIIFYVLGGYISSYKKGYISFNIYDANIAIANGNKPIVIAGSIITFALLIYLMILNKHQKRLYLRIGLLIIMFAMIQAIIWLNRYSKLDIS